MLAGILLIAVVFRFAFLGSNPPGLFRDEAEKGYTAWSLAQLGGYTELRPSDGQPVFHRAPLFIETPGSLISASYHYFAVPFVALGGLNVWTIRLPAAVAGTLTVGLCGLLALALYGNVRMALLAAALLAVSPWHVLFSRWAAQGILVPLFLSLGLWLLWWSRRGGKVWLWWPLGALALCLATYAYIPARLVVPVVTLALAVVGWPWWRRRPGPALVAAGVFLAVAMGLMIFQLTLGGERLSRLSVFTDRSLLEGLQMAARHYALHFSPLYLFTQGDPQLRHSIPGFGVLLHVEAPFFLIGQVALLCRRRREDALLLVWMVVAPIPAALTVEAPHALRSIALLPAPSIITALGVFLVADWWMGKARQQEQAPGGGAAWRRSAQQVVATLVFLAFLNVAAFAYTLFHQYPRVSGRDWQYGLQEAFDVIFSETTMRRPPPMILVSSTIHFAHYLTLAHLQVDPGLFRDQGIGALRPVVLLPSPEANLAWSQQAPPGSWMILAPGEPAPGEPELMIMYPGAYAHHRDLSDIALLLYRISPSPR